MELPGLSNQAAVVASAVRDGRARILWGESTAAVRASMIEAGVEADFAEEVIRSAMKERGLEIRTQGVKDLLIGVVVFIVGLIPLALMLLAAFPSMMLMAGASLGIAYGAFRLIRGTVRLVVGARAGGDVSDL